MLNLQICQSTLVFTLIITAFLAVVYADNEHYERVNSVFKSSNLIVLFSLYVLRVNNETTYSLLPKVYSHFAKPPPGVMELEIKSLLLTPATIIIPPSDDEIIAWSPTKNCERA